MNILFAASEVAPFIKTGGLADVAGSLPVTLAAMGHDVKVILPLYEGVGQEWRDQMAFLKSFTVKVAWRSPYCGLFELRRDNVSYLFVDNEYYFKRAQLYGHYDDGERFTYFSRAVIETPGHLDWHPDIIHCNDWQTALIPVYLLDERERCWQLRGTRSVFTIHNIEYQGRYGDQVMSDLLGLNSGYFNEHMLAYHGDVNLMKGGIYAADYVTTVSPTYAEELSFPFYAHGLEGVMAHNAGKMRGILNGIDTALYSPETDPLLVHFSADDLSGKAENKRNLQRAVGLREYPDVPIIACISRLVKHKGFEMITTAIHEIMGMDVQMVVLGTGDWNFEEAFRHAEAQYPGRFAARIQYSAALSTAIYGGADIFLMPSIAEPCGLSQMIAMRYGTVPVVRETGGLKDTVIPRGVFGDTGFTFADINKNDMVWVLGEAVNLYHCDKGAWQGLQHNGMTTDFSWNNPAREYEDIYYQISYIPRPIEPSPESAPEPAAESEPELPEGTLPSPVIAEAEESTPTILEETQAESTVLDPLAEAPAPAAEAVPPETTEVPAPAAEGVPPETTEVPAPAAEAVPPETAEVPAQQAGPVPETAPPKRAVRKPSAKQSAAKKSAAKKAAAKRNNQPMAKKDPRAEGTEKTAD